MFGFWKNKIKSLRSQRSNVLRVFSKAAEKLKVIDNKINTEIDLANSKIAEEQLKLTELKNLRDTNRNQIEKFEKFLE